MLTLLAVVTIAIVRQRSLFGVVILTSIYSFLIASVLIVLDAVDVAMTEASVGAGISTVLLLATLHLVKTTEMRQVRANVMPLLVALGTGGLLVWGTLALPPFGSPDSVIHKHVAPRYLAELDQGYRRAQCRDIGAGRLPRLRYARRNDGDFHRRHWRHAVAAPVTPARRQKRRGGPAMNYDLVLRVGTKLILPFILLFALYVQFHGDYGPGGGFQAGVIAAAMVILLAVTCGLDLAQRIAPRGLAQRMVPLGVLIYAGTGVMGLLLGSNFLDYSRLAHESAHGHELGIFSVEFGVLITVTGTMISIFYAFVERGRL